MAVPLTYRILLAGLACQGLQRRCSCWRT